MLWLDLNSQSVQTEDTFVEIQVNHDFKPPRLVVWKAAFTKPKADDTEESRTRCNHYKNALEAHLQENTATDNLSSVFIIILKFIYCFTATKQEGRGE